MKIWTVTYNDDNGVRTEVFNTAELADDARASWVQAAWGEDPHNPCPPDWRDALELLSNSLGFIDSIHVDEHDVHPPEPTGLDAILVEAVHTNNDLEVDGNAVVSWGEDPGAFVSSWSWVSFTDVEQPMVIIEPSGTVWYFDLFDEFMEAMAEEPEAKWVKGTDELLEKSGGPNDAWEYLTRNDR